MKHFRKNFRGIKSEAGATLVVIIIAMVVVAILGAGMLALFSTSLFNQTEAQKTAKAYYLAESGVRVAASEFLHATNQNQMLVDLQDKTFNIPGTGGSFKLHLYPYWFYVTQAYTTLPIYSIKLYLPGNPASLPPVNSDSETGMAYVPAPGILKLRDKTSVGVFTNAPVGNDAGGTFVTFTISGSGLPYAINVGNELYVGYTYNSPQAISQGGNLVFNDPNQTAGMYPPTNGAINITKTQYIYQYTYASRTIDSATQFTLHNIQPALGVSPTPLFPIQITYDSANLYDPAKTTQIYIGQTLGIRSKAEYVN
jgi:type II secretory pathway pseudopilin PulG